MTHPATKLRRDWIDLLQSRSRLLERKDRLWLTMYLDKGISFRQMGQLTGVSDRIIARRIHNLAKRLGDGQYIACLRNRSRFTDAELTIARDRFLMGLSVKKIARRRRLTRYRVYKTVKHIQQIIATV